MRKTLRGSPLVSPEGKAVGRTGQGGRRSALGVEYRNNELTISLKTMTGRAERRGKEGRAEGWWLSEKRCR